MDSKSKKIAKDEKQKDQRLEEQTLKSLDEDAKTPEERVQLLLRKFTESERSNRRFQQEMKAQEKQLETVLREKENLQREYNKSVLMREKLQEVCREQQKIIKSVKNESVLKIREAEERRKESQMKFQSSLNEITQSLTKNNDENLKLRQHNIDMTKKLKFLAEQSQTREQQLEKLNEQVHLEAQLHQAKLNKAQVEAAMEKEILIKEKEIAAEKLLHTQKTLKELAEREVALKEQLHLYTAKYDDFQNSLQKSNSIFSTYKTELEKMSKNTKKLEREAMDWKHRWEKSNASLIELVTEKKDRDDHVQRCNKQVEQLQKLLRAMQQERLHLYNILREQNIEIPALPILPPEPEPINTSTPTDKDKMEMMSRNCAELKETLANLQNQMMLLNSKGDSTTINSKTANGNNAATAKTPQQTENALKKRQKRKQKSKNNKNVNNEENSLASDSQQSVSTEIVKDTTNTTAMNTPEAAETVETARNADLDSSDLTMVDNVVTIDRTNTLSIEPLESDNKTELVGTEMSSEVEEIKVN